MLTNSPAAVELKLADPALLSPTPVLQLAAVRELLAGGADLHAHDTLQGRTALHQAAAEGHAPVVQALLAAGAEVNEGDSSGQTPLLCASVNGHGLVAQELLAAGQLYGCSLGDGDAVGDDCCVTSIASRLRGCWRGWQPSPLHVVLASIGSLPLPQPFKVTLALPLAPRR